MTSLTKKLQAALLSTALLVPAGSAMAQVSWSKPDSRTKGTVIGAVAGGLLGGTKGAIIGGAVGNGVQAYRHDQYKRHHPYYVTQHRRHRRHYRR